MLGIELNNSEKYNGYGVHRTVDVKETIKNARKVLEKVGITRIADITGLDRLGIPVVSATVPEDKCAISVNNGKGLTLDDAMAGAMMETIERYSAENVSKKIITGTYNQLVEHHNMMKLELIPYYIDLNIDLYNKKLDWVEATEIISGDKVLVPMRLVAIPWSEDDGSGIWIESTNGLGSGNTFEEAICHAINEVIERDTHTVAVLEAQIKPNLSNIIEGKEMHPSDLNRFKLVDLKTIPTKFDKYLDKISAENMELVIRNITSDVGIPTFSASLIERGWEGKYYCHGGVGTHPDSEIAIERAITEAAQSRLTDIQGAREDMADQDESSAPDEYSFLTYNKGELVDFIKIPSYKNLTVKEDIIKLVEKLKENGFDNIYFIDLTLPDINISVVRIVIPGLENWVLKKFDFKSCALGKRGVDVLGLK